MEKQYKVTTNAEIKTHTEGDDILISGYTNTKNQAGSVNRVSGRRGSGSDGDGVYDNQSLFKDIKGRSRRAAIFWL